MPQAKYERLLIERGHAKRRWENLPAEGLALKDLDRKEILRTRELAIQQNRISPDTRRDIGEVLDRLGLRAGGVLTHAAQVLYGTRFLPDYPQCLIKMGRFRGTEITGEIVDNRQEHMNAFAMVREGMAFLERTMPLGARFPTGQIFREDRFPIPLGALREILLNAVMHRDCSHYSGYVKTGESADSWGLPPHRRGGSLGPWHQPRHCDVQETWNPAAHVRRTARFPHCHVQGTDGR
jgi:ATP-dependent DNA helicase RecG